MEDYIKIQVFESAAILTSTDLRIFREKLGKQKGIINLSVDKYILRIEYNTYLIDIHKIKQLLATMNYDFKEPKKANRFQMFLQNLARSNKDSLGSGKLECCKLNK